MDESEKEDLGIATVLLERFTEQRLPKLLEIKERIDAGEKLDDLDLEFLETMLSDANTNLPKMAAHEDLKELFMKGINLYHEIVTKAAENEQAK